MRTRDGVLPLSGQSNQADENSHVARCRIFTSVASTSEGAHSAQQADAGFTKTFASCEDDAGTTQSTTGAHDVRAVYFTVFGVPNRCNGCARPEETKKWGFYHQFTAF